MNSARRYDGIDQIEGSSQLSQRYGSFGKSGEREMTVRKVEIALVEGVSRTSRAVIDG